MRSLEQLSINGASQGLLNQGLKEMRISGPLIQGMFIERLNRFLGRIEINGRREYCHIRDPGRLTEVLVPNAQIIVRKVNKSSRKTRYELISVKVGDIWVIVNSGLHNRLALELLKNRKIEELAEYKIAFMEKKFGKSRIDFLLSKNGEKCLLEVKGCTLVKEGVALFPDAPTKRGVKHLKELAFAIEIGYKAADLFLIMRRDANLFSPNREIDPTFSEALKKLEEKGAKIIAYSFDFDGREIKPLGRISIRL